MHHTPSRVVVLGLLAFATAGCPVEPDPAPAPTPTDDVVDDDDSVFTVGDFVYLPAGTFEMGCTAAQQADGNCWSNESPVHTVTLTRGFQLGATEVTQGQWQGLMGNNPSSFSSFSSCGLDCPVETVTWWESLAYANAMSVAGGLAECYSLSGCSGSPGTDMNCTGVTINSPSGEVYDCAGYRLPTEAEWEYAARAGTDLVYSGSDTLDVVGWYGGNSGSQTHVVATKQANGWGLYDMSGDVLEWTQDWYDGSYYSTSPGTDPAGPSTGLRRVSRGGSWGAGARGARVAIRLYVFPNSRNDDYGFRLAKSIP